MMNDLPNARRLLYIVGRAASCDNDAEALALPHAVASSTRGTCLIGSRTTGCRRAAARQRTATSPTCTLSRSRNSTIWKSRRIWALPVDDRQDPSASALGSPFFVVAGAATLPWKRRVGGKDCCPPR